MNILRASFTFAILLAMCASGKAQIIADLDGDWDYTSVAGEPYPATGWSFHWNPSGFDVGDSANYGELVANTNGVVRYVSDADAETDDFTNSSGFDNLGNNDLRIQEGVENDPAQVRQAARWITSGREAANSTDGRDHFAIVGYTIQAGEVDAGGSEIVVDTAGGAGGASVPNTGNELRVYLNDTLIETQIGPGGLQPDGMGGMMTVPLEYTINVGTADVGDTIYVAYLSDNEQARNPRRWFPELFISTAASGDPGDFVADGIGDGADFLEWQRTNGTVQGLADWQAFYGTSPSATVSAAAVPEPSTFALLGLSALSLACRRRRG